MRFLIDTNVLCEPTKPQPSVSVLEWLGDNEGESAINSIVLGELQFGILSLPPGRKRSALQAWLAEGMKRMNVLALDAQTATVWSKLLDRLHRKGRAMPIKDSLIAATALQFDLTLATRNVNDYQHSGVRLVNPFKT